MNVGYVHTYRHGLDYAYHELGYGVVLDGGQIHDRSLDIQQKNEYRLRTHHHISWRVSQPFSPSSSLFFLPFPTTFLHVFLLSLHVSFPCASTCLTASEQGIRIHDPQCSPNALVHGVQPSHDEPLGLHNDGTCWHSQP